MKRKVVSDRELIRVKIQTLHGQGYGPYEIARKLKVSPNTVYLWRDRNTISAKPKGKRQGKVSPSTKRTIKRKLYKKSNSSLRKTADALNQSKRYKSKNKTLSYQTVANYLKTTEWGKKAFRRPCKPLMSERNVSDRLKFGRKVEKDGYLTAGSRGHEMRSGILWTDETTIELNPKSSASEGRFRAESRIDVLPKAVPKFSAKLMIAGGFCSRGVTPLHFVEQGQNINAKYYRDKILPIYFKAMDSLKIFPNKKKITFMQDGAPCHSERQNMAILRARDCRLWGKGVWPGNSPDLNPIEHLWPILKAAVQKSPKPKDLVSLKRRIIKEWKNIPVETLAKYAESFKTRVEEMMKVNGRHTRY